MSDIYKCECGHTVHSNSKEPPQSLNWSDGHICILVKQINDNHKGTLYIGDSINENI